MQARWKTVKKQAEKNWTAIVLIRVLNWREMKSIRATSKATWHLFHKRNPSVHLGDLLSPLKSLEGEESIF